MSDSPGDVLDGVVDLDGMGVLGIIGVLGVNVATASEETRYCCQFHVVIVLSGNRCILFYGMWMDCEGSLYFDEVITGLSISSFIAGVVLP